MCWTSLCPREAAWKSSKTQFTQQNPKIRIRKLDLTTETVNRIVQLNPHNSIDEPNTPTTAEPNDNLIGRFGLD